MLPVVPKLLFRAAIGVIPVRYNGVGKNIPATARSFATSVFKIHSGCYKKRTVTILATVLFYFVLFDEPNFFAGVFRLGSYATSYFCFLFTYSRSFGPGLVDAFLAVFLAVFFAAGLAVLPAFFAVFFAVFAIALLVILRMA
ncbi:hypothetical protein KK062_06570 [Fulvivirgaceae bacterium PWU5]|uniref:Uncharacterized protein n=1 Tax=Dawidia cretensis TaxID=2782350 RepID=A0AAP2DUV6_9BACT|nr:hypothetical protein [Dawidia cretensis]MBT1707875.1 hypothetical protein [Dawidia cretensis]